MNLPCPAAHGGNAWPPDSYVDGPFVICGRCKLTFFAEYMDVPLWLPRQKREVVPPTLGVSVSDGTKTNEKLG